MFVNEYHSFALPFSAMQWKDIRRSSQVFTQKAGDVISKACFTDMTQDHRDLPHGGHHGYSAPIL